MFEEKVLVAVEERWMKGGRKVEKINSTDCCKCNQKRISYKERMEDALVHGAEEGRDKLRKATGSRK